MKNKRKQIIYISGPYTSKTKKQRDKNVDRAEDLAIKVWEAGFSALCPHLNTYSFEVLSKNLSYDDVLLGDLYMVEHCDALLMIEGWEKSKGAVKEREHALKIGVPVFYSLEELEKWGKKGNENGKVERLRRTYGADKKSMSLGEVSFFSLIGIILSFFVGVYIARGSYLVAFIFLNLLALKLIALAVRSKIR